MYFMCYFNFLLFFIFFILKDSPYLLEMEDRIVQFQKQTETAPEMRLTNDHYVSSPYQPLFPPLTIFFIWNKLIFVKKNDVKTQCQYKISYKSLAN